MNSVVVLTAVAVPVGGEIGRVFEIGSQAMSATAGIYYNAVHPSDGPDGMRA